MPHHRITAFLVGWLPLASLGNPLQEIDLPEGAAIVGAWVTPETRVDLHAGNPALDASTRFEIGSITKVFTTLGILLQSQVEPGLLERPLKEVFEELGEASAGAIPLRQLATHTSGLPRMPAGIGWWRRLTSPEDPYLGYDLPRLLKDLREVQVDPGPHEKLYSNFGFGVLGQVWVRESGVAWEELVATRLLEPFGMKDSFAGYPEGSEARVAQGIGRNGEPTSVWHLSAMEPAGGIKSSVEDLVRFLRRALQPGEDALGRALQASFVPHRERPSPLGLGWQIQGRGANRVYWHNGGTGGFHTFLALSRERQQAIVLLSNFSGVEDLERTGFRLLRDGVPPD